MKKHETSDALELISRDVGRDPSFRRMVEEEKLNARVAGLIRTARSAAGLTQAQLAKRVDTTQSAIARLEDAAYEGHSLTMLRRIAEALGLRVDVRLVAGPRAARSSPGGARSARASNRRRDARKRA